MLKELQFDIDDEYAHLKDMFSSIEEFLESGITSKSLMDAQNYLGRCEELIKWLSNVSHKDQRNLMHYKEKLSIYGTEIIKQWKTLFL